MSIYNKGFKSERSGRAKPLFPGPLDHVGPFEVRGVLAGDPGREQVTAGWREGEIYGDELALTLLRMEADCFDGIPVGPPTGPFTTTAHNHLKSPVSAYTLMENVFSEISALDGPLPYPRATGGAIP